MTDPRPALRLEAARDLAGRERDLREQTSPLPAVPGDHRPTSYD